MDSSHVYWLPWLRTYQLLQAATRTGGGTGLEKELKAAQQWLLQGGSCFKGPSEESAAALKKGGSLKAASFGPNRGIAIDSQLVQASLELSQMLGLDELQTHLLLRRVLKEKGIKPNTAAAQGSGATAAAADGTAQLVVSADDVQAVADAYGQERAYLVKCQHLILMTALDVSCAASKTCRAILQQLLDQDWAVKVLGNLKQLLANTERQPAAAAAAVEGVVHAAKPPALDQHRYLQQLNERCELMSLLTHLYAGADALTQHVATQGSQHSQMVLSPEFYAAQTLLSNIASRPDQLESEKAEAEALTGALQELVNLPWPSCSEQQFLQLVELLGSGVYATAASAAAASAPAVLPYAAGFASRAAAAAMDGSNGGGNGMSQAQQLQQLSEALGASLVLAALRPAQLLMDMAGLAHQASNRAAQQQSVTSHLTNWRSIIPTLDQWRPVPGNVIVLLAVHAYYQLLVAYSGTGGQEDIQNSLQEQAQLAGGFSAPVAALELEDLGPGTPAGWLHRGLVMQGLSLVALAGDTSPWRLPAETLEPFVMLVTKLVQGCPHLAAQVWEESVVVLQPLRAFLDESCELFPAYLSPFVRLATGLVVGPEAAEACYEYLSKRPPLVVQFSGPGQPGLQIQPERGTAYLEDDLPWPKAPEVIGTVFPGNIYGTLKPLPAFAQQQGPPASDTDDQMAAEAALPGSSGPFLVAWELQADQGMAQVLLLARAAHCLQRLHALDTSRQQVAGSDEWQDLCCILGLVATLLRNQAQLADTLLGVSIVYNNNQTLDWVDIIVAALNVLPGLAARSAAHLQSKAAYTQPFVATTTSSNGSGSGNNGTGSGSDGSSSVRFAWNVLNSLADCLTAAAAAAACQPSRVLTALCSCQLFDGVAAVAEPLPLVPLEELGSWVQQQQASGAAAGSSEDWSTLHTLQGLQQMLEVQYRRYPLTRAVVQLTSHLLVQQSTWGPVPSLVGFTLHRVLGALPWLPFNDPADRWQLAAEALAAVRLALTAGAEGRPWCAGPKDAGPPAGVMVTQLAARMVHHLATAGHGYLSSALPPPAMALQAMADQVEGSSQQLQAAMALAGELLRLVPLLLGACAHLSPEMPLQQYWGVEPPGGGMRPAAVITSYVLYAYSAELQLLARHALNTFAILQAPALQPSSRAGFKGGIQNPSSGGPAVPLGPSHAAGLGALAGPVQPGLNPAHALGYSGHHGIAGTGLGVASQGGAGGWFRSCGLFAVLLSVLPGLKEALLEPLRPEVATTEPDMALSCLDLLEAGVRHHPELLDALCFPTSLQPQATELSTQPSGNSSSSKKASAAFSALDGLLQLVKQAPQLMSSQPKLLSGALRVLGALWECQASAHGAVELLRAQPELWQGLKACLPVAAHLPSFELTQQLEQGEAAAWQLQVHADALRLVLMEVLMDAQAAGQAAAGSEGGAPGTSDVGRASLLSALSPADVAQLVIAAADLDLALPLLPQLAVLLQICYLQVGGTAVTGAWATVPLKSDAIRVGALFRQEVMPLLQAAAAGQFTQRDLAAAPQVLADVLSGRQSQQQGGDRAAAGAGVDGNDDSMLDLHLDLDEPGSSGRRAAGAAAGGGDVRVLVDGLLRRPLGKVLLSYAAVTGSSWAAGEAEYGRSFLFSSDRILAALGASHLSHSEALAPLCTSLDELSVSAGVAQGRLTLLQAATALLVGLAQQQGARQQLLQPPYSQQLISSCLQAVDKSLMETIKLYTCQAAPLLSVPWGLHFLAHSSSAALLTASRALLQSVRFWKAALATTSAAAAADRGFEGGRGRPALLARALNHQGSLTGRQQHGSGSKGSLSGGSSSSGGSKGRAAATAATAKACASAASILSRWLRGPGGNSLAQAAVGEAVGVGAAVLEQHVESVECMGTSLLLLLQALPAQQLAAARAAAAAGARRTSFPLARAAGADAAAGHSDDSGSPTAAAAAAATESPAELLELEAALLELLPPLCKACATAVGQQQAAAAAIAASSSTLAAVPGTAAELQAKQAYVAVLLQLLIEILRHQLAPSLWLQPVSRHLDLVPMLTAVASRAASLGPLPMGPPAGAAAGSGGGAAAAAAIAGGFGSSRDAATAAAAAVGVTDVSVLELLQAVAETAEGALQLWQQGVLPVLVGFCRQLLHGPNQSGLLGAAALGYVGPDTNNTTLGGGGGFGAAHAGAEGAAAALPPLSPVMVSTVGAYMSPGDGSSSSSSSSSEAAVLWSPRHQQWCLLLSLWSSVLQQLSRTVHVTGVATEFLTAAEPRLHLALQLFSSSYRDSSGSRTSQQAGDAAAADSAASRALIFAMAGCYPTDNGSSSLFRPGRGPGGSSAVLLTLANLLEAERSLQLLKFMVNSVGDWELQRPGSLASFRAAAASLVEFVAAPTLDRSFQVSCSALSPFERRLAANPSGLPAAAGWFKVCVAGGANSPQLAAAAAAGSSGGGSSAAAAGALALVPAAAAGTEQPGTPSASAAAAAAAGGCSEYAARLAEAIYTVCDHALALLAATAPAVDAAEVSGGQGLGPMWPSVRALAAVLDQALAVGESLVGSASTPLPTPPTPRQARIAATCSRITAVAGQLLGVLSPGGHWGAAAAAAAGRRAVGSALGAEAEAARRFERMTSLQRATSSVPSM